MDSFQQINPVNKLDSFNILNIWNAMPKTKYMGPAMPKTNIRESLFHFFTNFIAEIE
jgi:hypothetical protein